MLRQTTAASCVMWVMMMIAGYTQGTARVRGGPVTGVGGEDRTLAPASRLRQQGSRGQFYVTLGVGCTCCLGPGFESLEVF